MEKSKNTEKAPKKDYFNGLKAEFKKIIWPSQEKITKQAIAVLTVAIALGLIITLLDFVFKWGLSFII